MPTLRMVSSTSRPTMPSPGRKLLPRRYILYPSRPVSTPMAILLAQLALAPSQMHPEIMATALVMVWQMPSYPAPRSQAMPQPAPTPADTAPQ